MKRRHLIICLLLLLICMGCKKEYKEKAAWLTKELGHTDMFTARFDSLMTELKELPVSYRLPLLVKFCEYDGTSEKIIVKQETLLLEALTIASKKEKKEILFLIIKYYETFRVRSFYTNHTLQEGYNRCLEVENQHALSEDEQLLIYEYKANILTAFHDFEKVLALHYQSLEIYRKRNNPELIIDQLIYIGSIFQRLNDVNKAVSFYEEANQLAAKHKLPKIQKKLLTAFVSIELSKKEYKKAIKIYEELLKVSSPDRTMSLYREIADCYLKIDSTATARLYLFKGIEVAESPFFNGENFRAIASTYIQEQNEDSARSYLQKSTNIYKQERIRLNIPNIHILPFSFIETYTNYARLLEKKEKYQDALNILHSIDFTLKKGHNQYIFHPRLISAYSTLSSLYQKTGAYKDAIETLLIRDSIQTKMIEREIKQNKQNIIDLYKNRELATTVERQSEQLANSQKVILLIILLGSTILGILLILYLMYRLKKRQLEIIYKKQKEIDDLKNKKAEATDFASTEKLLFEATKKLIQDKALFKKADLTLDSLATLMNTNRTYLSSCINTYAGKNFSQWLNEYRIDYVVNRISQTNNLTLLAKDAGFASTASFYRYFKQHTQITPKQYLEQMKVGA